MNKPSKWFVIVPLFYSVIPMAAALSLLAHKWGWEPKQDQWRIYGLFAALMIPQFIFVFTPLMIVWEYLRRKS